jgi:hypothetical protein
LLRSQPAEGGKKGHKTERSSGEATRSFRKRK